MLIFLKKDRVAQCTSRITLLDANDSVLTVCPTGKFALFEAVVLALSREYFNAPEPCAIHHGAVHRRAIMELLERCPAGETASLALLSPRQQTYFADGMAAVRIEEV